MNKSQTKIFFFLITATLLLGGLFVFAQTNGCWNDGGDGCVVVDQTPINSIQKATFVTDTGNSPVNFRCTNCEVLIKDDPLISPTKSIFKSGSFAWSTQFGWLDLWTNSYIDPDGDLHGFWWNGLTDKIVLNSADCSNPLIIPGGCGGPPPSPFKVELTPAGYFNGNAWAIGGGVIAFNPVACEDDECVRTAYVPINDRSGPAPVCGDASCNGTETCSTCSADCGICSSSQPTAPSVTLKANNTLNSLAVQINTPVNLTWTSSDVSSCSTIAVPPNWTNPIGIASSSPVPIITSVVGSQTYTINCTSSYGSASSSVTVVVTEGPPPPPAPEVDLKINGTDGPLTVAPSNLIATLTWTLSGNPTACSLALAPATTLNINPLTATQFIVVTFPSPKTYTLTCSNAEGSDSDSVTIDIPEPEEEITELELAACGNNNIESGEECDGGESCSASCKIELESPTPECVGEDCLIDLEPPTPGCVGEDCPTESGSICGNGIKEESEECDGGQGCGSNCQFTDDEEEEEEITELELESPTPECVGEDCPIVLEPPTPECVGSNCPTDGDGDGDGDGEDLGDEWDDFTDSIINLIDDILDIGTNIGGLGPVIIDVINNLGNLLNEVLKTTLGKILAPTIGALGLLAGLAGLATLLFTAPGEIFARLWNLILSAVGATKKKWGIVFDATTGIGLDPAYVSLIKIEADRETEVASAITNLEGEYGLAVREPGIYKLIAQKTNFNPPPSKILTGQREFKNLGNLYFGEPFEIKEAGQVLPYNIPLDPTKQKDWNEIAKEAEGYNKKQNKAILLYKLSKILFNLGFLVAAVALVLVPGPYNIIIFGLYCLIGLLRRLGFHKLIRKRGRVIFRGAPLAYAFVEALNPITNTVSKKVIAGPDGRFFMLLPKGNYYVRISQKVGDAYNPIFTSKVIHVRKLLKNQFEI